MFEYVKNDTGDNFLNVKDLNATAGSYAVGDALVIDGTTGVLKLATGTTKPQYISAATKEVTDADMLLPVNPVYAGQEWKADFSADGSAVVAGSAVTIDDTGKFITATTTGGVFTVIENLGTAAVGKFL